MSVLQPYYAAASCLAILLALLFPTTRHFTSKEEKRSYYQIQFITLLGAALGAKLSVMMGDYNWPWESISDWHTVLLSGRSITGAFLGGFLAAELAKPLIGYTMPPNDRFAAVIPFSISTGRVGCFLTGCCGGIPYNGVCAIKGPDGIPRHPAQLYELGFHLLTGIAFMICVHRKLLFGRLFSFYLMIYGVFRFLTEPLRDTPKTLSGLSGYQWISIGMILVGAGFFVRRSIKPPVEWSRYSSTKIGGEATKGE